MSALGWLTCDLGQVPVEDDWLSDAERAVLSGLSFPKRRRDWRLGRWAAKAAVSALCAVPLACIEVLAASDGAPDAWVSGARIDVSLSLSHRADRALAVVRDGTGTIGCDLEVIEPRSPAFVLHWLAPAERELVATADPEGRPLLANLFWSAKEAAAKARRQGLRLDVRDAVANVVGPNYAYEWEPLTVNWADVCGGTGGWWRHEPGWVIAIAGEPAPMIPRRLAPGNA